MEKFKLFQLFVFAFFLSLIVQYFFLPKNTNTTVQNGIILSVKDDSIVIPNIPIIEIKNSSTGSITLNACKDMKLTIDSIPVTKLSEDVPALCQDIRVDAGMTTKLPLDALYQVFASRDGKYSVTLSTPFGERIVFFSVAKPGFFRSFLSTVVYQPIYNLFVALLTFLPGHSLGWAIIIVTIIIRIILLVPQNHMLEGQKKLQKLQPKIKALQKEYKNDQATLGMKMLELYKTEGVNPLGSILPLFIQMPILIGLYWVISQINEPSNFYHLYSFFENFNPTTISTLFWGIDLAAVGGVIALAFALALGILQYIQAKLSFSYTNTKVQETKKEEETPTGDIALDPKVMQNMMLYFFPVLIAVTSYFFPLGVGLYWFIGTLFVIAQQAYVNRKHG